MSNDQRTVTAAVRARDIAAVGGVYAMTTAPIADDVRLPWPKP